MKKRRAYSSDAVYAVPERNVGIAPTRRQAAKVLRGPNRSHAGPATRRTRRVATKAMMLELETSFLLILRSLEIVTVN